MSPEQPRIAEGDLLRRAQRGDESALEALYATHLEPARRLAHVLAGPSGAEDLVADAFARVLAQLRAGRGPSTNLRGYLFATIRNRHRDILRRSSREAPASDEPWLLDGEAEDPEELGDGLDEGAAVAALATLPGSWQQVLWHLEVEGRPVPEVASMLRMTPAAVSSLAYRAREGLKSAYLRQHLPRAAAGAQCSWTRERLASYVRGGLSPRASAKLDSHLNSCAACSAAAADLARVNRRLAALAPLLLLGGMGLAAGPLQGSSALSRELAGRGGTDPAAPAAAAPTPAAGGWVAGLPGATGLPGAVTAAGLALVAAVVAVSWWAVAAPTGEEPTTRPDAVESPAPGTPDTALPTDEPAVDRPAGRPGDEIPDLAGPGAATEPVDEGQPPPTEPVDEGQPADPLPGLPLPAPAPAPAPGPTPPPAAVRVTAVAPAATPIAACGTYGSLVLPSTEGISYTLVEGDGRQGPWRVTATALRGHVLAEGSPRGFSGDLGAHYACPRFNGVALGPGGSVTTWRLSAPLSVSGPARRVTVAIRLANDVLIPAGGVRGAGWTCWGPDGAGPEIGADRSFFFAAGFVVQCRNDYAGAPPEALSVAFGSLLRVPAGTLELSTDGVVHDTASY